VLFVGTHERQLDDKGRVALPAPFRAQLGETCYLSFGTDQCIDVLPADQFERMAEQVMAKVERGEISLAQQRVVSGSASMVTVDKQGRVNLDETLRNYAGLRTDSRVIVTGNFTRVEIWAPELHERIQNEGRTELAGGAAATGDASAQSRTNAPAAATRRERGSTKQTPGSRR
jgi:MraZ protein